MMITVCSLTSCNDSNHINVNRNKKGYPVYLYQGSKWDILQINDSIVTMVPSLNGSTEIKPVIVNIKNFGKNSEEVENSINE